MVTLSLTSKHFNILLKVSFFGSASCFWLIFVKYKEQQILDKICKVTRPKQISYFDFVPFFDFQYEKIIFNCQPSHFLPCSAVPVGEMSAVSSGYFEGWTVFFFFQQVKTFCDGVTKSMLCNSPGARNVASQVASFEARANTIWCVCYKSQ